MTDLLNKVITDWTRVGVAFDARPSRRTPDLERLLLATARTLAMEPRLLTHVVSWLATYPEFVASHRLTGLVVHSHDFANKPQLGLLLDLASDKCRTRHFRSVVAACHPQSPPQPLYDVQRTSRAWSNIARKESSDISRRWGLWCQPVDVQQDAIYPAAWIVERNPSFFDRAVLRGDLRLSILECLRGDPSLGRSELRLVHACAASRNAVRAALRALEQACYIRRESRGNRIETILAPHPPANVAA